MKYLLIVLAFFATSAFADSNAAALAGSAAQSASLSGSASIASQGNAQNITINGAAIPTVTSHTANTNYRQENVGTSTVRTVPQVYAPPMGVTAPCRVALSGGISVIGVGVAAGGSVPDAPCNLRELSRTYQALGNVAKAGAVADGALALECLDETVAKALGPLCPAQVQPLPTPAPQAAAPAPVAQVAENKCTKEVSVSGIVTTTCK